MVAVTVYRDTDAGAPQLGDRKPSEIMAIIKACAVDGYGDKAPLGWSVEFDSGSSLQMVLRNSIEDGGSGGYVQLEPHSTDASHKMLGVTPSIGMSGINEFIKPGYQTGILAHTTTFTSWTVIGTKHGFYFLITNPNGVMAKRRNVSEHVVFIGDLKPFIPNDAGRFSAIGGERGSGTGPFPYGTLSYSSSFASQLHQYGATGAQSYLRFYGSDGQADAVEYGLHCLAGTNYDYIQANRSENAMGLFLPIQISVRNMYANTTVSDPNGENFATSQIYPLYRFTLPGLISEVINRYSEKTWPYQEELQGHQHWLLSSHNYTLCKWINIEEW